MKCAYVHVHTHMYVHKTHVCLFVCLSVCNSNFLKVAKNEALTSTVQTQCNNISNFIFSSSCFVTICNMICLTRLLLWHIPDSAEDKSACNGSLLHLCLQL